MQYRDIQLCKGNCAFVRATPELGVPRLVQNNRDLGCIPIYVSRLYAAFAGSNKAPFWFVFAWFATIQGLLCKDNHTTNRWRVSFEDSSSRLLLTTFITLRVVGSRCI